MDGDSSVQGNSDLTEDEEDDDETDDGTDEDDEDDEDEDGNSPKQTQLPSATLSAPILEPVRAMTPSPR